MNSTLAIIPALNEEASLPFVIDGLRARHPSVDVLVVDDGSTDATARIAREHGAIVAKLPFNMGIGAALRTGFRFADERGYARAFQFDADGQHDSGEVEKLLAALDDGADLVIGTRFSATARADHDYRVGLTRGSAMGVLRLVIRILVGRSFTDTSSGFRGFSRQMIELFSSTYPREYMDSVEALVLASYHGFRVEEVAVRMHERAGGVASNRNVKLLYHYMRLVALLLVTFVGRSRAERTGAQ